MLIDRIKNTIQKGRVFFSLLFVFLFSFILNKNTNLQEKVFYINTLFAPIERIQYTLKNYTQLTQNLESLEKEVIRLKAENQKLLNLKTPETADFRRISNLYDYIGANVIFFYPGLTSTSFVVDRGHWRGITKEMAVIDTRGVLGKVVKTTQNISLVTTINDPSFRIGVKTSNNQGFGIVQCTGHNQWNINHINDGDKFRVNDTLFTSGYGGIFPENIPFGTITKITSVDFSYYPEVEVEPFANYKNPNHVFLVKNLLARELNE